MPYSMSFTPYVGVTPSLASFAEPTGWSSGAKQVENLQQIWVIARDDDLLALRNIVSKYGGLFGQEAMYFEHSAAVVEFLPTHAEKRGNGTGN